MADKEAAADAAAPDKQDEKKAEAKPDKKPDQKSDKSGGKKGEKKKNPLVLFGILGAVVVGLTAASYFVVVKLTAPADAGSEAAHAEPKKKEGKVAKFEVKDLILNPADTGSTHFVKVSLVFEIGDAKLLPELEEREYRVRDLLIRLIGRRTSAELASAEVREEIRSQILDELNSTVADGSIHDLFFTDFIIQ